MALGEDNPEVIRSIVQIHFGVVMLGYETG